MKNRIRQISEHIMNDTALGKRLAAANSLEDQTIHILEAAETINLAVSRDEVTAFLQKLADEELSDAHLEAVAGGKEEVPINMIGATGSADTGDNIYGTDGDDTMNGGSGNDTLRGGIGSDKLSGGSGDDIMEGGRDNDFMFGGSGDDIMEGDDGSDYMTGGDGNDTVVGDDGNDTMVGGAGDDSMLGGSGDDLIYGEGGDDVMSGGDGNDTLHGGWDNDIMTGGSGSDVFVISHSVDNGSATITDFKPGEDKIQLEGLASSDGFTVSYDGGNTVIQYGNTQVTVMSVELTTEQIMEMQFDE